MASYLATLRPPHYKFKRKVLYKQVDVEAWLEGCRVDSAAVAANITQARDLIVDIAKQDKQTAEHPDLQRFICNVGTRRGHVPVIDDHVAVETPDSGNSAVLMHRRMRSKAKQIRGRGYNL